MDWLTRSPVHFQLLIDAVVAAERGAVATFLGLVRNHHGGREVLGLEYSAYEPMAHRVLEAVVAEAESRWPVRVGVQHRLGALQVGEVAVAIAVAGDHRDEVFQACRYVIEALKDRVPIWKKETYRDGTIEWVDPTRSAAPHRGAKVGKA